MKRKLIVLALGFLFLALSVSILQTAPEKQKYDATYGTEEQAITVATGSQGALGLLRALTEPFCQANNCRINWTKKGSGVSLKALKEGRKEYPRANYYLATKFVRFASSLEGQKIIRKHGKAEYCSALYNDAEHAKKWDK